MQIQSEAECGSGESSVDALNKRSVGDVSISS